MDDVKLYSLLPEMLREEDSRDGNYALKSLLFILQSQLEDVELSIRQLYNNWYPQTCDQKLLPFLGYRLGMPINTSTDINNLRREVINSIRYRRRKGLPWSLEQLAENISGWPCHVQSQLTRLGCTQNVKFTNPSLGKLTLLDNTFISNQTTIDNNLCAHTIDVKTIDSVMIENSSQRGKYGIDKVIAFCSPVKVQRIESAKACKVPYAQSFTFSSVGFDLQLFSTPLSSRLHEQLIGEENEGNRIPTKLKNKIVNASLSNMVEPNHPNLYYGKDKSFYIRYRLSSEPNFRSLTSFQIVTADLSSWQFPTHAYSKSVKAAIDVERGRICFRALSTSDQSVVEVITDYHYAQSINIGGGSYDRSDSLIKADEATFNVQVSKQNSLILETTNQIPKNSYRLSLDHQKAFFSIELIANGYTAPVLSYNHLTTKNVASVLNLKPLITAIYWPENLPIESSLTKFSMFQCTKNVKLFPCGTFDQLDLSSQSMDHLCLKDSLILELDKDVKNSVLKIHVIPVFSAPRGIKSYRVSIYAAKTLDQLKHSTPYVKDNLTDANSIRDFINTSNELRSTIQVVHAPESWSIDKEYSEIITTDFSPMQVVLLGSGDYSLWPDTLKKYFSKSIVFELLKDSPNGTYTLYVTPDPQRFDSQETFSLELSYSDSDEEIDTLARRAFKNLTFETLNTILSVPPSLSVQTLPLEMKIPKPQDITFTVSKSDYTNTQNGIVLTLSSYTSSISDAIEQWLEYVNRTDHLDKNTAHYNRKGLIEVIDNSVYTEPFPILTANKWSDLTIQARNGVRPTIRYSNETTQPSCIKLDVKTSDHSSITFNGFHFYGALELELTSRIVFTHCSVYKAQKESGTTIQATKSHKHNLRNSIEPSVIQVNENSTAAEVILESCITGALQMPVKHVCGLVVLDSIVSQGNCNFAIAGYEPNSDAESHESNSDNLFSSAAYIDRSTILGPCNISSLTASNSIFTRIVFVRNQQTGFLRYCYSSLESQVPVRYKCQPAVNNVKAHKFVAPVFVSNSITDASYARLSQICEDSIASGAEGERQMGVFHRYEPPNLLKKLTKTLKDNLPVGLELGVYLVE